MFVRAGCAWIEVEWVGRRCGVGVLAVAGRGRTAEQRASPAVSTSRSSSSSLISGVDLVRRPPPSTPRFAAETQSSVLFAFEMLLVIMCVLVMRVLSTTIRPQSDILPNPSAAPLPYVAHCLLKPSPTSPSTLGSPIAPLPPVLGGSGNMNPLSGPLVLALPAPSCSSSSSLELSNQLLML